MSACLLAQQDYRQSRAIHRLEFDLESSLGKQMCAAICRDPVTSDDHLKE
jgi:hypothetical protein